MEVNAPMNASVMPEFARIGQRPGHRIAAAVGLVILAHVGLLVFFLTAREKPVQRPIESQTITAELISAAPQPVTTPVAIQSAAPPQPTPPKPRPKPTPVHHAVAKPTPAPMKTSDAPSQFASPGPADPAPPPAAPATPSAAAPAAPAIGRETLNITAPKDVPHLDCNIAKPDYPYISKRQGESGTVVIRFVVGLTGGIEDIRIQKSSGHPRLDDAALDAMHASACSPYKENGQAIRAAYSQPFVFGLTN